MSFELVVDGDRLCINGPITVYEAAELNRLLLARDGHLNLDLSGVTEMDGAGFQVLVAIAKELEEHGYRLSVTATAADVWAYFAALGADRYWAPLAKGAE